MEKIKVVTKEVKIKTDKNGLCVSQSPLAILDTTFIRIVPNKEEKETLDMARLRVLQEWSQKIGNHNKREILLHHKLVGPGIFGTAELKFLEQ